MIAAPFALPAEPHVPGRTPRPDETIFAAVKASVSGADPARLGECAAFTAGLAAFEAGYFWEAHEIWEPVWMLAPPASRARQMLQGLIQLANAGLKHRMARPAAAQKALARADYAFAEAYRGHRSPLLGLTASDIAQYRSAAFAI